MGHWDRDIWGLRPGLRGSGTGTRGRTDGTVRQDGRTGRSDGTVGRDGYLNTFATFFDDIFNNFSNNIFLLRRENVVFLENKAVTAEQEIKNHFFGVAGIEN